MPRVSSDSATDRRAAYRIQLTAALLLICRKVRRLQKSADARKACDDIMGELRALAADLRRRKNGKS